MVEQDAVRNFTGVSSVLSVIILLIFVTATSGVDNHEATAKVELPKKPLTDLLTFRDDDYNEAFKSLDKNNDNEINVEDLKSFYNHKDSEFAIQKFIHLLDTTKTPGKIDLEEFTKFMKKDHVKRKVHEVTIIPTLEARKKFFADKILTYVYLVLDENAINSLFTSIETSQDQKLDLNEIKNMQVKIMNGDTQHQLTDGEAKLILAEIGAGSDTISKEDFKNYLLEWELGLFFRECRKGVSTTSAEYDNACLIRNLVRYAKRHMTEYMMSVVFNALDGKTKDGKISYLNLQQVYGCSEAKAKNFLTFLSGANKILSYGDLRTSLRVPSIKHFLEQSCFGAGKESLEERSHCLIWKLWYLISINTNTLYHEIPDLDLIFVFEDLDTSNNGIIEKEEDLEKGKNWDTVLATKFMEEVGHTENKAKVNLYDFFSYLHEPYMMCAVGECQIIKNPNEKLTCYSTEMVDVIGNVLHKKEVDDFFGFYKNEIIYYETLDELHTYEPVIETYLDELGQGDHYVNHIEFKYFVKQQDLGHLFLADESATTKEHLPATKLHEKLLYYLEHYMSEFDIVILFGRLDKNNDMMIDREDIESVYELDEDVVEKIALYGNKNHATLQEFWLFINSKPPGSQETRRKKLQTECGQVNQEREIRCYASKLKDIA